VDADFVGWPASATAALRPLLIGLDFAGRFGNARMIIVDAGQSSGGTTASFALSCSGDGGVEIALVIPPHSLIVFVRNRRPRVACEKVVFSVSGDVIRLGATRSLRQFTAIRFKFLTGLQIYEQLRNFQHSIQSLRPDPALICTIPAAHPKYTLAISSGMM
jgi:hypothetical protein